MMRQETLFHYALIGILLVLLYIAFLILQPYITYLLLGFMLTYLLYPLYEKLNSKLNRPYLSSTFMVLIVILLVIIPFSLFSAKLVGEAGNTQEMIRNYQVPENIRALGDQFGINIDATINTIGTRLRTLFSDRVPDLLGSLVDVILGLFVMFFIMIYAFPQGKYWLKLVKEAIPLQKKHRQKLLQRIGDVTAAVMYGQFLTALVQGIAGGIMLALFGIPNPIFWGALMVMTSIVPVLGSYVVWLPIALWQLANGDLFSGIGILLVGSIVIGNLDNIVRPYLIGSQAELSTPIVLLGVLGGIQLFGLIGIILGPLLLALLQTVFGFFRQEKAGFA